MIYSNDTQSKNKHLYLVYFANHLYLYKKILIKLVIILLLSVYFILLYLFPSTINIQQVQRTLHTENEMLFCLS